MSDQEQPADESETVAALRQEIRQVTRHQRWRRPGVGYFEAHPPRETYPTPEE